MDNRTTLNERMARLEKQNRYMKVLLSGLLVVAACVLLMGAASDTTIRASKIIVPRSTGRHLYSHLLTFEAEGGTKLVELRLSDGGPSLRMYDKTGNLAVNMGGSNLGGGSIHAKRPEGRSGTIITGRGLSVMAPYNYSADGTGSAIGITSQLQVVPNGPDYIRTEIGMWNKGGVLGPQVELSLRDFVPSIKLRDEEGNLIFQAP